MHKFPLAADDDASVLTSAPLLPGLPQFAGKFIPLQQARDLYRRVNSAPRGFRLEGLLSEMKIDLDVLTSDFDRIPTKGALIAVANHPFGVLDGVVLSVLLLACAPTSKSSQTRSSPASPGLEPHCFFVDPFNAPNSADKNLKSLKLAIEWLRQGGALAVFPAGEVSQIDVRQAQITDPEWSTIPARLIRKTGASALPVYFHGHNSMTFQLLGLIHPRLRTLFSFAGVFAAARETGAGPHRQAHSLGSHRQPRQRRRSHRVSPPAHLPSSHRGRKATSIPAQFRSKLPRKPQEPIADAVPHRFVVADIAALPADRLLTENAEFAVYAARGSELPHVLEELGRLREITFRASGEGTGRSIDVDDFDAYYWHLLLWNKDKQELAGPTARAIQTRSSARTASRASTRIRSSATTSSFF